MRISDRFAAPASCQPDVQVERADTMRALKDALGILTPFEHKLLSLKGVSL